MVRGGVAEVVWGGVAAVVVLGTSGGKGRQVEWVWQWDRWGQGWKRGQNSGGGCNCMRNCKCSWMGCGMCSICVGDNTSNLCSGGGT